MAIMSHVLIYNLTCPLIVGLWRDHDSIYLGKMLKTSIREKYFWRSPVAQGPALASERECPLLGVKRTSMSGNAMSAFDPKRT
jgi:hypothetical protein